MHPEKKSSEGVVALALDVYGLSQLPRLGAPRAARLGAPRAVPTIPSQLAVRSLGSATGLMPLSAALSRLYAALVAIAAGWFWLVAGDRAFRSAVGFPPKGGGGPVPGSGGWLL